MSISVTELAHHWGCKHQHVSRCVKRGCPLTSFEDADLWREANRKRESRSGPPPNEAKIQISLNGYNGQPLDSVVTNSARTCEAAWKLLEEAFIEGKPSKIGAWMSLHNKAVEARVKAEGMVREELERQKILIRATTAKERALKLFQLILTRIGNLPANLAARVNPSNPLHAIKILEAECNRIVADAHKEFEATMS